MQEKLIEIIADQLGVTSEEVTPEKTFDDLNADSLDFTEIIMTIEDQFSVELPQEEAEKMVTVGDLLSFVEKNKA